MVDDSMATDRIIGMIQPKTGESKPDLFDVVFVELLALTKQKYTDI